MDHVVVQKTISFLGSWKCNRISEHLLREIGTHSSRIQGSRTKLQVSKAGIKLIALDASGQPGKSTLVPVSNILNITINRFKPECLLCVVKDELRKLSVLVCRCKSEKDIVDIIQFFNEVKKSQSGEGYNTNIRKFSGQNWSLKTNGETGRNETNRDIETKTTKSNLSSSQNGNYYNSGMTVTFYDNKGKTLSEAAIQTELDEDLDSASSMSSASVKAELLHLSEDVREIKRMLELSGVSETQHFKRTTTNTQNGRQVQYKHVPATYEKNREVLRSSKEGKLQSDHVIVKGDSIKIVPDHDIRSFAVQTESKNRKSSQENYPTEVSAFSYGDAGRPQISSSRTHQNSRASSSSQEAPQRYRFGSDSSVSSDVVFLQYPRSPDSIDINDRVGKVSHFITPPPENRSKSLQIVRRPERDPRSSVAILSSTVPRSIENVYSAKRYRKKSEHKGRVVITPKTFINGDIYRKSSDSDNRKSSNSEIRKSSESEKKDIRNEKSHEIKKVSSITSMEQRGGSVGNIKVEQQRISESKIMNNGDTNSSKRSSQNTLNGHKTDLNGSDNQIAVASKPGELLISDNVDNVPDTVEAVFVSNHNAETGPDITSIEAVVGSDENAEIVPDTSSIKAEVGSNDNIEIQPDDLDMGAVIGFNDDSDSGDESPAYNGDHEITTPEGVREIDQAFDF